MDILWWILIVDTVVFGGLTAWLATTKSRSGFVWFVLGSLLGPLALLAVGLAPASLQGELPPRSSGVADLTKQCPDCGEDVRVEARICRFCRDRFLPSDAMPKVDIARELAHWESLGLWIVGTSLDDRLAKDDAVEIGLGASRLLVILDEDPVLDIGLGSAFIDRAGDRVMSLSDGPRRVASFKWYSGSNAKEAEGQLNRAKVEARARASR